VRPRSGLRPRLCSRSSSTSSRRCSARAARGCAARACGDQPALGSSSTAWSSARPCRASVAPSVAAARAQHRRACLLVGVLGQRAALRIAEGVGQEHLGVAVVGLEQHDVGVGVAALVALHAQLQREWISERKVWLSTTGRPPSTSAGCAPVASCPARGGAARAWRRRAPAGSGTASGPAPSSSTRRMQRLLQRAVDVVVVPRSHRREQPRQRGAGLPPPARSAHGPSPGWPKGRPRRCPGRWPPAPACAQLRKSLVRPGARTGGQLRFHAIAAEQPGGQARPRRSSAASSERRPRQSATAPAPPGPGSHDRAAGELAPGGHHEHEGSNTSDACAPSFR
jgi:hypothetical protein